MLNVKRILTFSFLFPMVFCLFVSCAVDNSLNFEDLQSTLGGIWNFDDSTDYTFDENQIEIVNGKAQLKVVDTQHSGTDFNSGTHVGTYYDSVTQRVKMVEKSHSTLDIREILSDKNANLIRYYRMDNNGWADSSGNGVNGTDVGTNSFASTSIAGTHAGLFDGTTSGINIGKPINISQGNPFSISLWFRADTIDVIYRSFISFGGSDGGGNQGLNCYIQQTNNQLYCVFLKNGIGTYLVYNGTLVGTNYHVALTSDGTTANFYVNGVLQDTEPHSSNSQIDDTFIGSSLTASRFDGMIDEVALFNVALSANDISSVYQAQSNSFSELSSSWTPKWDNIVGYWKMDGNWQDSSGNGNHGTANSDATFSSDRKVGSQAGTFDGVGDSISIGSPVSFSNKNFSISLWTKRTSTGGDDWAFGVGTNSTNNALLMGYRTNDFFQFAFWANDLTSTQEYPDENQWVHWVGTYDTSSNSRKLYRNGILENSDIAVSDFLGSGHICIGAGLSNCSAGTFLGNVDDVSVWTDYVLSDAEVVEIYNRQKQKYAGHYDSPVIDLGASGSWTNIDAVTSLPFGKEIVAQTSESSSDYSSIIADFSDSLEAYWPLNEASSSAGANNDFLDLSPSANHLEASGATFAEKGIISNSPSFDGVDDVLNLKNRISFQSTDSFTLSIWYKGTDDRTATYTRALFGHNTSGGLYANFGLEDGYPEYTHYNTTWLHNIKGSVFVADGKWHHLVYVNHSNETGDIYVDGVPDITGQSSVMSSSKTLKIDHLMLGHSNVYLRGQIDEPAVWSRDLSPAEIQQLYRRGANRVKYQVKSCVDSSCECKSFNTSPAGSANDCDGDGTPNATDFDDIYKAEFTGPGGNGVTAFSELFNRDSSDMTFTCNANTTDSDNDICVDDEITLAGDSNTSSPSFDFSLFPNSAQPSNNRYFQYRVMMEAEDNTACSGEPCLPELTSVEIGPTGRYYSGSPSVVNKTSHPIDKALDNLQVTSSSGCNMSYQISNDGTNFYYWDGSAWTSGSSVSQSNDLVTLNNKLSNFTDQIGFGDFYFKSYLGNSSFGECELDRVQIIKSRR